MVNTPKKGFLAEQHILTEITLVGKQGTIGVLTHG